MGSWKHVMPEEIWPPPEDDLERWLWEHRDEGADGPEVPEGVDERQVDESEHQH